MTWWQILALAIPTAVCVIGFRYDRRTPGEKEDADRRKLGYAVGVPTLFDRRDG